MAGRFSRLKQPKTFVPLIVTLLIIAAFVMAIRNLNSPAEGTITQNNFENPTQDDATQPKQYSDKYISFTYPDSYTVTSTKTSKGVLDAVSLVASRYHNAYVSVGIIKESLAADSGVTYRNQHPELYKVVSSSVSSVVYAKNDNQEYTGFIEHNGMVASISFTSVAPRDMSQDYKTIADSLKWNQP